MIYARNSGALAYRGIHPNLDLALEHITPEFLSGVGYERTELSGSSVYATRFTYETVPEAESFFEAHKKYLDIHIMTSGSEGVEIAPPEELEEFLRFPGPGLAQADPVPRGVSGGLPGRRPPHQNAAERPGNCDQGSLQSTDL